MSHSVLKIGVLLPRSTTYPTLTKGLLAGMQLYFEQSQQLLDGQAVQLISEDIGFGQSLAEQKAYKLLDDDQVDLVVGVMNPSVSSMLHDIFQTRQKVFINSTVGANILRNDEFHPFFFSHSLSHWQSNWALGGWAAQHLGPNAAIAMSFYDSGYDAHYAFRVGFENQGGDILRSYITHRPPDTGNFVPFFTYLEEAQPDFVYAAYCGQPAIDFVRAYGQSDIASRIPLVGSGFLVDEQILPEQGEAAIGITTASPWVDDFANLEYQHFAEVYQDRTDSLPGPFAMLGFETAHMIADAVNKVDGHVQHTDALREAFVGSSFVSPRGHLTMNRHMQETTTPLYLREVQHHEGTFKNNTITTLDIESEDESITTIRSHLRTGWINEYLCV